MDHIDEMLHDCHRILTELEPLLAHMPQVQRMLGQTGRLRAAFGKGGNGAIPKREATPFYVGQASADSKEVGA